MNCYRHANNNAIGVCKSCQRNVCHECVTEVGQSLACTDTCTDKVAELVDTVNTRLKQHRTRMEQRRRCSRYAIPNGILCLILSFMFSQGFEVSSINLVWLLGIGIILFGILHSAIEKMWVSELERIKRYEKESTETES